ARTVLQVLDALGLERVSLLGHSMGGGVAIAACALEPKRFSSLVPVCALAYPGPPHPLAALLRIPGLGEAIFHHAYARPVFARDLRALSYGAAFPVTEEAVDFWWERLCRPGSKRAAYAVIQELLDFTPFVPQITSPPPSHVIWGESDRLV